MSEGLNKVMLLGQLGADPELRMTASGQAVLNMRVATTERYKDKSETWQERAEWHNVVLWGKRGEALSKFLAKGSQVFVEGGLRTTSYEKDGGKRYKTEVVATNIILAGKGGERRDDAQRHPGASAPARKETVDAGDFPDDDDIPF